MIVYSTIPDASNCTVYVMQLDTDKPDEPQKTFCMCPGPDAEAKAQRIAELLTMDELAGIDTELTPVDDLAKKKADYREANQEYLRLDARRCDMHYDLMFVKKTSEWPEGLRNYCGQPKFKHADAIACLVADWLRGALDELTVTMTVPAEPGALTFGPNNQKE